MIGRFVRALAKALLPPGARERARTFRDHLTARPEIGTVRFGDLARLEPVSRVFGFDRGRPIDRHYIEDFLARHAADVRGRVLEIGDATYTKRFGGANVTISEVLHAVAGNPEATRVGSLAEGAGIPDATFDCVILTQTLPFLEDVPAAIQTVHRILRPGGVCLATVPGISAISRYDMDRWGDWWRFTSRSAAKRFGDVFGAGNVAVETRGNVLAAVAFLHGLATEELSADELAHRDPDYELVITVRAVREGARS